MLKMLLEDRLLPAFVAALVTAIVTAIHSIQEAKI
jgi:flagellar biosynthesis protein FliQ